MSRELDVEVAIKVMAFEEVEPAGGTLYYHNVDMDRESTTGGRWRSPVPRFSTDIAAAMQVEDRIEALGQKMVRAYVEALDLATGWVGGWRLVHATPRERCIAALTAITAQRESGEKDQDQV